MLQLQHLLLLTSSLRPYPSMIQGEQSQYFQVAARFEQLKGNLILSLIMNLTYCLKAKYLTIFVHAHLKTFLQPTSLTLITMRFVNHASSISGLTSNNTSIFIFVCMLVIITHKPLHRFVSNFDWGTRSNYGNVLSLDQRFKVKVQFQCKAGFKLVKMGLTYKQIQKDSCLKGSLEITSSIPL